MVLAPCEYRKCKDRFVVMGKNKNLGISDSSRKALLKVLHAQCRYLIHEHCGRCGARRCALEGEHSSSND